MSATGTRIVLFLVLARSLSAQSQAMLKTAYLMGNWTTMAPFLVWLPGWEFYAVLKSRPLSKGEVYMGEKSWSPDTGPRLWFLQPETVSFIIHRIWTLWMYTREVQIRSWKLFSSIVSASQWASLLFKLKKCTYLIICVVFLHMYAMCNDDQIRSNGIVIIKILFTHCHPQLPYWAIWTMKCSIPTPLLPRPDALPCRYHGKGKWR